MRNIKPIPEGTRYGRLVVTSVEIMKPMGPHERLHAYTLCQCDCGKTKHILKSNLRAGRIQSCGCLQKERTVEHHQTHGKTKTRAYSIWADMKQKCTNPNRASYPAFGGKGVSVCEEWLSFDGFWDWASQNDLAEGSTLVLIDATGNFAPDNVRVVKSRARKKETQG